MNNQINGHPYLQSSCMEGGNWVYFINKGFFHLSWQRGDSWSPHGYLHLQGREGFLFVAKDYVVHIKSNNTHPYLVPTKSIRNTSLLCRFSKGLICFEVILTLIWWFIRRKYFSYNKFFMSNLNWICIDLMLKTSIVNLQSVHGFYLPENIISVTGEQRSIPPLPTRVGWEEQEQRRLAPVAIQSLRDSRPGNIPKGPFSEGTHFSPVFPSQQPGVFPWRWHAIDNRILRVRIYFGFLPTRHKTLSLCTPPSPLFTPLHSAFWQICPHFRLYIYFCNKNSYSKSWRYVQFWALKRFKCFFLFVSSFHLFGFSVTFKVDLQYRPYKIEGCGYLHCLYWLKNLHFQHLKKYLWLLYFFIIRYSRTAKFFSWIDSTKFCCTIKPE